jgi:hypothetical protein
MDPENYEDYTLAYMLGPALDYYNFYCSANIEAFITVSNDKVQYEQSNYGIPFIKLPK